MSSLRCFFTATILGVLVVCAFVVTAFAADESSAASAVAMAEADMVSAYAAVLEAEQVGANVSLLLVRLNDAGESLARAEVAYRLGDFNASVDLADVCAGISEEVKSEAYEVRNSAGNANVQRMWYTMIGSTSGVILVILGSLWFWRIFKRRYFRRVLKMKLEVTKGES
ncbi:MAG: hypothetical protein NWE77_07450 [Candidatus Bathyarchaeota archaeon]|nr:hypothetical protein [Candidatus Bathyarchaeota archaeon]